MLDYIHLLKAIYHAGSAPLWLQSVIFIWHGMDVLLNPLLYIVLATVTYLEWRIPTVREQRRLSAGFRQDLFWYVGDRMVWLGALALLASGTNLFYQSHLSFLSVDLGRRVPRVVEIAVVLLVQDFAWWGFHYLKHSVSWLWAFHAVHHSQKEMNLFTDFRVHPGERALNVVMLFIPLSMFRIGMPTAFYIAVFFDWYRVVYHANIRSNYGPFKYFLVTPQFHRVHHSTETQHADKNFGVVFTIWDRMFGTHWDDYDQYPATGIVEDCFPVEQASRYGVVGTWVRQTAYPFFSIFRLAAGRITNLDQDITGIPDPNSK